MAYQTEDITGTLVTFRHFPDKGGFGYGEIEILDEDSEGNARNRAIHKIAGVFPSSVHSGDRITARGRFVDDSRWGRQFKVTAVVTEIPRDRLGMIRCLDSFLPNIGEVRGNAIVDKFGVENVTRVLEYEYEKLVDISGITPERAEAINRAYLQYKDEWEANTFFAGVGLTTTWSQQLIHLYGAKESVELVQENPYRLDHSIPGFGFKRCEDLALSLGIKKNDRRRLRAGIIHTLREAARDGHCSVPASSMKSRFYKLLGNPLDEGLIDTAIAQGDIVEENGFIFLPSLHRDERIVAHSLMTLRDTPFEIRINQLDEADKNRLNEDQRKAVDIALQKRILVMTGGPGTGKTFTLRFILDAMKGSTVLLAAPTGRAAKRIEEVTGCPAQTIHRMLAYRNGKFDAGILGASLIIIDEVSMLDLPLAARLFERIDPSRTQVILIGDVDQLPSVGPGSVLRDTIESEEIPCVRLTKIMRQAEASPLVIAAHAVRKGTMPDLTTRRSLVYLQSKPNMDLLDDGDEEQLQEAEHMALIKNVCSVADSLIRDRVYNRDDIQVLCPQKIGPIGSEVMNRYLQTTLNPNPRGTPLKMGETLFCIGDRVVQTRNNYSPRYPGEEPKKRSRDEMEPDREPVFNGDLGTIVDIYKGELSVEFGDRVIGARGEEVFDLQLAYALTVHKSQGSEYPCVILPVHPTNSRMLQRNLLYTGLTRAKIACYLVGKKKAIQMAVDNDHIQKRFTTLKERLIEPTEWDVSLPALAEDEITDDF